MRLHKVAGESLKASTIESALFTWPMTRKHLGLRSMTLLKISQSRNMKPCIDLKGLHNKP